MKKRIVFLFFVSNFYFLPFHSYAQDEPGVDTVKILCFYEQVIVLDTLNPRRGVKNPMLLQIGNHYSKYYSFFEYLSDSLTRIAGQKWYETGQVPSGQEAIDNLNNLPVKRMPRELNYVIFKNYPKKGQLTLLDHFGFDNFKYEEPLPDMRWQLTNDTLTVYGYLCKKATTSFRGRNYTVWYTPEIPVSDGPWKFNGLPGLILKATDEQKYFSFKCTAIETPKEIKPIFLLEGNGSRKVNRAEYNKAKQRYMDSPGAYASGNPVMTQTSPLPATAYEKRPYNPMERAGE